MPSELRRKMNGPKNTIFLFFASFCEFLNLRLWFLLLLLKKLCVGYMMLQTHAGLSIGLLVAVPLIFHAKIWLEIDEKLAEISLCVRFTAASHTQSRHNAVEFEFSSCCIFMNLFFMSVNETTVMSCLPSNFSLGLPEKQGSSKFDILLFCLICLAFSFFPRFCENHRLFLEKRLYLNAHGTQCDNFWNSTQEHSELHLR